MRSITIKELPKPRKTSIEEDISWLINSLGLVSGRDLDNSMQKIVVGLLKKLSEEKHIKTEKLSEELQMDPQKINYHIRALMKSGFLYREKRCIYLRQGSIQAAIEEIRKDANRIFDNLSEIARDIDLALGTHGRNIRLEQDHE